MVECSLGLLVRHLSGCLARQAQRSLSVVTKIACGPLLRPISQAALPCGPSASSGSGPVAQSWQTKPILPSRFLRTVPSKLLSPVAVPLKPAIATLLRPGPVSSSVHRWVCSCSVLPPTSTTPRLHTAAECPDAYVHVWVSQIQAISTANTAILLCSFGLAAGSGKSLRAGQTPRQAPWPFKAPQSGATIHLPAPRHRALWFRCLPAHTAPPTTV